MVARTCHKPKIKRIARQASLGKKWNPISKIIRGKKARGMGQEVEHLLSKAQSWVQTPELSKNPKNSVRLYSVKA
jgi:hypothetical protein